MAMLLRHNVQMVMIMKTSRIVLAGGACWGWGVGDERNVKA